MKRHLKYILLAIFLVYSASLLAQDTTKVVLPASIARKMFVDAKENKKLQYELHKDDSTIHVYEAELISRTREVKELHLSVDEYKVLVQLLKDDKTLYAQKEFNWKKERRQLRTRMFVKNCLIVAEVVVLVLIVI